MERALFWDFDGTLIHANTSFFDALTFLLHKYGYAFPDAQIKDLLLSACSWYSPEAAYVGRIGRGWWEALFDKFKAF